MSYKLSMLVWNDDNIYNRAPGTPGTIPTHLLIDLPFEPSKLTYESSLYATIWARATKPVQTKAKQLLMDNPDMIPCENREWTRLPENSLEFHKELGRFSALGVSPEDTIKILPLIRLNDCENYKDYCLVLAQNDGVEAFELLRMPIAQLGVIFGKEGAKKLRYKLTGEEVEFISTHLEATNSDLEEFLVTDTLFTGEPGNMQMVPLLMDRNNTVVGFPLMGADTQQILILDLKNAKHVGELDLVDFSKETTTVKQIGRAFVSVNTPKNRVVILNWDHLMPRDLDKISEVKSFAIDGTPEDIDKQFRILSMVVDYKSQVNYEWGSLRAANSVFYGTEANPAMLMRHSDAVKYYDKLVTAFGGIFTPMTGKEFLYNSELCIYTDDMFPLSGKPIYKIHSCRVSYNMRNLVNGYIRKYYPLLEEAKRAKLVDFAEKEKSNWVLVTSSDGKRTGYQLEQTNEYFSVTLRSLLERGDQ